MSKAVLKRKGKKKLEVVDLARQIVVKMTGNIDFPNPFPLLTTISTHADDLETKIQDSFDGGTRRKKLTGLSEDIVINDLNSLMGYVQSASEGDAAKILSTGFEIRSKLLPQGFLLPPANVRSLFGIHEGEIIIRWNGVKGRTKYLVQINDTPADDSKWRDLIITGKIQVVASGLITDHVYAFRITTLSTIGYGGFSEVTKQKAL